MFYRPQISSKNCGKSIKIPARIVVNFLGCKNAKDAIVPVSRARNEVLRDALAGAIIPAAAPILVVPVPVLAQLR